MGQSHGLELSLCRFHQHLHWDEYRWTQPGRGADVRRLPTTCVFSAYGFVWLVLVTDRWPMLSSLSSNSLPLGWSFSWFCSMSSSSDSVISTVSSSDSSDVGTRADFFAELFAGFFVNLFLGFVTALHLEGEDSGVALARGSGDCVVASQKRLAARQALEVYP